MKCGETRTGFKFEYDERNLDDLRLVELTVIMSDPARTDFERMAALPTFIELLLGREIKDALYAHIGKSYEGRVPYAAMYAEMEDITLSGGELKN